MLIKIGWFSPPSGRAFRVVTSVECPVAAAQFAVNISYVFLPPVFGHDQCSRLDYMFAESGGLANKLPYAIGVILCEQGRDDVPLGREGE